jgi:hypothetical protein
MPLMKMKKRSVSETRKQTKEKKFVLSSMMLLPLFSRDGTAGADVEGVDELPELAPGASGRDNNAGSAPSCRISAVTL